ncbi:unnamed protein product [Gongylonema pulchrum]|uniref:Doublecortin domain-containing protein n=1 Tax=Gongylonema pulchrum TaxID=637853 RepID=A0A183EGJ5_9BILA|nr:unnamed protein product [Gongylonema pulchrum]
MYQIQDVEVIPGWDGKSPVPVRKITTNYIDGTADYLMVKRYPLNTDLSIKRYPLTFSFGPYVPMARNLGIYPARMLFINEEPRHAQAAALHTSVSNGQPVLPSNKVRSTVDVAYSLKPLRKAISPIPQKNRPTFRRGRNYLRTISRKIPGRMFTFNNGGSGDAGAFIEIDPAELGYFIEEQDRPLFRQNYTSSRREITERTVQAREIPRQPVAAVAEKSGRANLQLTEPRKIGIQQKQTPPPYIDNEPDRSTQDLPASGIKVQTSVNSAGSAPSPEIGSSSRNEASGQTAHQQVYPSKFSYRNEPPVQTALTYKGDGESTQTVRYFKEIFSILQRVEGAFCWLYLKTYSLPISLFLYRVLLLYSLLFIAT